MSRPRWWQAAAVVVAAGLTVALTQKTTGAVFTGQTSDTANSVTATSDFCSAPGRVDTLQTAGVADTAVYQSQPNSNFVANNQIGTISTSTAVARTLIKFTLLSRPTGCFIASATLTMRVGNGTAGSTINVHRAAASWNAATVTWNSDPGFTGTAASAASVTNGNVISWNVLAQVTALYAGPDYGFEIKDANENVGNTSQLFDSTEATTAANRPKLVVTWG